MSDTKRYGPGIWEDEDGALHFSVPEIMEHFGIDDTPENQAEISAWIAEELKKLLPQAEIRQQDDCPHCGLLGMGKHKEGCPYR